MIISFYLFKNLSKPFETCSNNKSQKDAYFLSYSKYKNVSRPYYSFYKFRAMLIAIFALLLPIFVHVISHWSHPQLPTFSAVFFYYCFSLLLCPLANCWLLTQMMRKNHISGSRATFWLGPRPSSPQVSHRIGVCGAGCVCLSLAN